MLREDHDKTRKYLPRHVCHAQAFCLSVYPAVLLRKLTNNYKTFLSLSSKKNVSRQVYKRIEITTKHASTCLVTFVTHKRFAFLFTLPSFCLN